METIKANLDGTPSIDMEALYLVDFTKIESVNDLVLIFAAMGISFSPAHPHFAVVQKFLALDNPIKTNKQIPQPQMKAPTLPKLKKID